MNKSNASFPSTPIQERQRLQVDLAPALMAVLDSYCDVTGQAKTAVITALLIANLPQLHEAAKDLRKRSQEILNSSQKR